MNRSDASTIAAPPDDCGQQSSSLIGQEMMRDASTSSIDTIRAQMRLGIQRRVPAVLHRDARHVLLGHAVALHVAHRRHRQHVDRAKRQRTLVAGVPDLVQHRLQIAAFADLVGARGQHDVEHAGRDVVIRRRHGRDAGGTAVVDAQERLVASAHRVHAQAVRRCRCRPSHRATANTRQPGSHRSRGRHPASRARRLRAPVRDSWHRRGASGTPTGRCR